MSKGQEIKEIEIEEGRTEEELLQEAVRHGRKSEAIELKRRNRGIKDEDNSIE